MSPVRRDGEGNKQGGHTWESLVERQIREAMDAGAFDELAWAGRRLPVQDDPTVASERSIADHLLRQSGVAPPWVATDRELRDVLERIDRLFDRASRSSALARPRDREELVALVEAHEQLAFRLEQEAPTPAQHRGHLDLATQLDRLAAVHAGRPDPVPRAGAGGPRRPRPGG